MNLHIFRRGAERPLHILALGLFALSCAFWFVLDPLKYRVADFLRHGGAALELPALMVRALQPTDYLLLLAPIVCFAIVVIAELRSRTVSDALQDAPPSAFFIMFAGFLLWFGHSYLYAGYLLAGDAGSHISRTAHWRMGLERSALLFWNNYSYGGSTLLQFTGPLYFWITALADFFIKNANLTTKLSLFALHFAAAFATYRLLLYLGIGRFGALIGALAYGGSFAHLHLLIWESAYPQAVTYLLMPLSTFALERVLRDGARARTAWFGLVLACAALLVNHQSTGVFAGLYLALYALGSLSLGRAPWSRLFLLMAAAMLAGLLSLFAYIPLLIEKQLVMMYDEPTQLFQLVLPSVAYFKQLLIWNNGDMRGGLGSYIGLSIMLFAVAGGYLGMRMRHSEVDKALVVGVLVAALVLSMLLRGSHVRHIAFTVYFASLLCGFGAHFLQSRFEFARRHAAWLLLLLFVDLGTAAVQPLARTDKNYFDAAATYLNSKPEHHRTLLAHSYGGSIVVPIGPGGPPLMYERIQMLTGAHNLAVPLTHNYHAAAIKLAEADLHHHGALTPASEAPLAMLNVARIVNDTGYSLGLPQTITQAVVDGPLGRIVRIDNPTPALYAPRLHVVDIPPGLDKPVMWNEEFLPGHAFTRAQTLLQFVGDTVARMQIDRARNLAIHIPVRAPLPPAAVGQRAAKNTTAATIQRYRVDFNTIELTMLTPGSGFVQLAHPWYPFVHVHHNGARTEAIRGAFNHLVVPVQAGSNAFVIEYKRSPLRVMLGWMTVGVLAGMFLVWALIEIRDYRRNKCHSTRTGEPI